jgi:hypothetical protein
MFTAADIQARVRAQPFVPFRVTTSSGQTYDIRHPEFVFVMRRFLEIGIPAPEEPDIPDQVQRVALLHITSIDDLPAPSPPPGANGPG